MKAALILSASLLAPASLASAAPPEQNPHDRLFQLFKTSDDENLRRNPLQALYRGDYRFAGRLGDLFSDAHYQREKRAADDDLAAPHAIPRNQLRPDEQRAYDVFEYQ